MPVYVGMKRFIIRNDSHDCEGLRIPGSVVDKLDTQERIGVGAV